MKRFEIEIGKRKIEFEKKNWTIRATGEASIRSGETEVLAAAVMSENEIEGQDFFPLTVNYEEKFYAGGKILGSRYMRREGKPSDNATLICRLIDRTIRPAFPKGFKKEVQIVTTCLSWDEENDPDILGILATSLSLALSKIPWDGPVAAVRVCLKNNEFIVNPTYEERENSLLDIVLSGKKDKTTGEAVINMIEAEVEEIEEKLILEATKIALPKIKELIEFQEKISHEMGEQKMIFEKQRDSETEKVVKEFLSNKIEEILFAKKQETAEEGVEKSGQLDVLRKETIKHLKENHPEKNPAEANDIFEEEVDNLLQQKALTKEARVDGRKLDEIRPLDCQVAVLPRAHGSGYFSRGVTRSLSIVTLGGPEDQQLIEGMEETNKKRFLHHYNFPPYSTGEAKPMRGPGRREIGHGMLAEKALLAVIPDIDNFPYTIRIVSEILSSNGSTSMSSVCSSTLALMDAGVPIKRPVAGIAIGLVKKGKDYKLLTDIQGPEDFHGKMDFKVAGTRGGITAIQMDVKIDGIDEKIMAEALARAKEARLKILDLIEKTIPEPRAELSKYAPRIFKIEIDPEKIGMVIGTKGQTIKDITERTGAEITIEESGVVYIVAADEEKAQKAISLIKNIVKEIEIGESFEGTVRKILGVGAIIELSARQKGLLRGSLCPPKLQIGDKIQVRVIKIDDMGRIDLGTSQGFSKPQGSYGRKPRGTN